MDSLVGRAFSPKENQAMKRTILYLTMIILASSFGFRLNTTSSQSLQQARASVSVLPSPIYTQPGQQVTVDLNVSYVENLFAYDASVWYQNSFADAVTVVRPAGHFLEPVDPANEFAVKWEIRNDYNETHGRIWLSYTLLFPEIGRSGSGILARITFLVKTGGSSHIVLNDYPGVSGPLKLAGENTFPIPHTATDGVIIVSPSIDASRVPTSPNYKDYVSITANVQGLQEGDIQSVILSHFYSTINGSGATNKTMTSIGSNAYTANIPPYLYSAIVEYKIYLLDKWGRWSVSNTYSYVVIDNIPPEVMFVTISPSRIVKANITEPTNASGVDRAYFSFKTAKWNWWNTTMNFDPNTRLWTVTLPLEPSFMNQTLEYAIAAYDKTGNSASASATIQPSTWWLADINADGHVDIFDAVIVATNFGKP